MSRLIGLYSAAPSSGKTTVARLIGGEVLSFAAPIKHMTAHVLRELGYPGEKIVADDKERKIPELGVSARQMMQTLGTEWGRGCVHPDLWLKIAESKAKSLLKKDCIVVFDDVRFPNEVDMISRLGGGIWLVDRPGIAYTGSHASEGLLSYIVADALIINNGTIQELEVIVRELMK